MKRPGMLDSAEIERRFQKMIEEIESLTDLSAELPDAIPGRDQFIEDTVETIDFDCGGTTVHKDQDRSDDKRTVDDSTTEWIQWANTWRFETVPLAMSIAEEWYLRAFGVTDRIVALFAEVDAFKVFKGGKAKGLDREQWKPGMHDSEARWRLAHDVRQAVEDWWQQVQIANEDLPVINFFVLTGTDIIFIPDPCGFGGMVPSAAHVEGPWYQMEADRLNAALDRWHASAEELKARLAELAGQYKETFRLFKRGSQTAKRGI